MSAVLGHMKLRMDENETEKLRNVKKVGGEATKAEKVTRRAALGDIQNRAIPRAPTGKEAAAKEQKELKLPAVRAVAAVKPRVDSHWKKGSTVASATAVSTNHTGNVIATKATRATALMQASKVLTRSNSLRSAALTKTNSTTTVNNVQRQANVIEQTTKQTSKTLTTKMVENKLQQVKIIKQEIIPADTKLRREDSNISRKSLTKLKAALASSKTTTTSTTTTTTTTAITKSSSAVEVPTKEAFKISNVIAQSTNTNLRIVNVKSHSSLMLEGVRDIDEGDEESLILVSEYVNDIYDYLFQLEKEQPVRKEHLSDQLVVTSKMRSVLLDWIHEVHSQFHLVTETFHITVGIIDRYLQAVPDTLRSHLQLVGVTALFIAAKYEELYPPAICDFIFMTDHSYTQKQLLDMEIQIFRTLDCNLSRPVSIHFLRRFSKAADVDDEQHAMSKYFLELAAIEYDLAHYRPSEIAAASLFLSQQLFKGNGQKATGYNNALWNATLQFYSHYTAEHLRPISMKIATIARHAPDAKLTAVYTKYQSPKFYKASLRSILYSALMDSLIITKEN